MKKQKLLWACFTACTLLFSNSTSAQQVKFTADAEFYSVDPSGCNSSYVFIFLRNGKTNQSKDSAKAKLEMTISLTDECNNQILLEAQAKANLMDSEISFDPKLGHATLDATIQMRDTQSKNAVTADALVEWAAIEETVSSETRFEVEAPGRIERRARPVATSLRLAEATGTISLNGGTNLILDSSTDAAITSAR